MSTSTLRNSSAIDHARGAYSSHGHQETSLTWKRLLWKESKQVMPLVITLIGLGVFLQLLALLTPNRIDPAWYHGIILVLIPGLLAVGIGPMLVSQEKELRTISWIGSLPVKRSTIITVKLIVGFLSLSLCWFVGVIVAFGVYPSLFGRDGLLDVYGVLWPINTLFLAILSFSLAWICPTAISALITLVPIAALPLLMASLQAEFFPGTWFQDSSKRMPSLLASILNYSVVALIVAGIASRYGRSTFVSNSAPSKWIAWWNTLDLRYQPTQHARASTQGMMPSLLWQSTKQNRMILVFALSMFIAPMLIYGASGFEATVIFIGAVGALMLSWLGASVFGSDGTKQRIRFLADRGVSPSLVWWTRQILPFAVVVFALVAWCGLHAYAAANEPANRYPRRVPPFPWMVISMVTIAVYAFTQWSSQWIRSSLVSFCFAPAVAIATFAYGTSLVVSLDAPWWLIGVSILLPFIASRVMMRPWMDGRMDFRYWLSQSGFLIASLLIPTIPFFIAFTTTPGMPSSVRSALLDEAKGYGKDNTTFELVVGKKRSELDRAQAADGDPISPDSSSASFVSKDVSQSVHAEMEKIEQELVRNGGAIVGTQYGGITFVFREASLASLQLDQNSNEASLKQRYANALMLLNSITERLRMRGRLMEQEYADRLEYWLVNELKKPNRRATLGADNYSRIVRRLADQTGRAQARRRAILMSWEKFNSPKQGNDFGGLLPPMQRAQSMASASLVRSRFVGHATHQLLQYLDLNDKASMNREFEELCKIWRPSIALVDDVEPDISINGLRVPGSLWHRSWETDAQSLVSEL